MTIRLNIVRQRMLLAFFVRLIMLLIIIMLADKVPAFGFIANSPDYDDYRYEEGAAMYAEKAHRLIDVNAFTEIYDSMEDWTGHNLSSPLTQGYLWYWIVCILVYLTKWRWWIRILNIILSAFITKYIYGLTTILFSEKTARTASLIYALFPYTVVFSCFSYKDTLVSFCILYIALFFAEAKHEEKHKNTEKIKLLLVCFIYILIRSGTSEIFIALCLFYYYFEVNQRMPLLRLIAIVGIMFLGIILFVLTSNLILFKFNAYIGEATTQGLRGGALLKITGIKDIWKLPFTYVFSILQPIGYAGNIDSWFSIVSRCNILMCPIAVASILELIFGRRNDRKLSFILLLFYLICSISSILIFRQLYSIWPIPLMYASNYLMSNKFGRKAIVTVSSVVLATLTIVVLR